MTLLEMVVVLAILVAVTTLAIRVTSDLINEAKYDTTKKTLDSFRVAVIGNPASVGSGAAPQISSFAADLGRLPRAVQSGANLTLSELFSRGSDTNFQFIVSTEANTQLVWDTSVQGSTALNRGISSGTVSVQVPVGWRGPYLYPSTLTTFVDGWGKSLQGISGTTNSPVQLLQFITNSGLPSSSYTVATQTRAEIMGIAVTGGASGGVGTTASDDAYLATQVSLVNLNDVASQVVVQFNINGLSSGSTNLPPRNNLFVDIRVFGPNPNADSNPSRPIRCVIKRVNYDSQFLSVPMSVPFLIGPKVVLCEIVAANGANPTTVISSFTNNLSAVSAFFQPGVNFVQISAAVN